MSSAQDQQQPAAAAQQHTAQQPHSNSVWTSIRHWLNKNFVRHNDTFDQNPKNLSWEPPHPRWKS
jgi:hypothetical protein